MPSQRPAEEIKIQITEGPFGKCEAIWRGDRVTVAPHKGKIEERVPLSDIRPVELIGGGTTKRTFKMILRDGRSLKCSMRKREYARFIKVVGVTTPAAG